MDDNDTVLPISKVADPLFKCLRIYCEIETREVITHRVRYMTLDEQLEREQLNSLNTASALRARVVAELSKGNGHSESSIAV